VLQVRGNEVTLQLGEGVEGVCVVDGTIGGRLENRR
jgi:hypothetical protein